MRSLLIVVTVVALALPLLPIVNSLTSGVLAPWLTCIAAPVCLLTAAVYCRGRWQTFFLGAAGAAALAVFSERAFTLGRFFESLLWAVELLVAYLVCGGLALATRVIIESRGWHLPPNGIEEESID